MVLLRSQQRPPWDRVQVQPCEHGEEGQPREPRAPARCGCGPRRGHCTAARVIRRTGCGSARVHAVDANRQQLLLLPIALPIGTDRESKACSCLQREGKEDPKQRLQGHKGMLLRDERLDELERRGSAALHDGPRAHGAACRPRAVLSHLHMLLPGPWRALRCDVPPVYLQRRPGAHCKGHSHLPNEPLRPPRGDKHGGAAESALLHAPPPPL
mmetsp:Transcript_35973/g.85330  ORF Transcript_35973/g.85330 Transcript_35973/m.85330 type:complete len:213 (-) Transcript_35973:940-1578(-)